MKNIQVKLTFQADTKAAKQEMASLQQQLSNLTATPIASAGTQKMRNELQQAANKAVELKVALHNATNVDTGKLNLNKFSQQLKQNKMTLTQYAQELAKLGPQGTQAFLQLTNSIRQAETPMIALTGKVKALTDTLMNTLRWQISSSLITGVISTFTSIIDYSEELNESLNNIRIVTGKNIEQMSKFADAAQKSAKALSSTTTEYTNAALIYYQQGLSDKEVKERTDTTIKLANAVGEEAQTVSEWMTAIWNNFDDGSKSMEYYADVLAKLGAATASSADEIAGGLEKFAAVAETTGLSYEYAAAALATITSETRQSEDVVGTALKTIFARIENLKLGETLEDGLNLGQYSAALEKVGVNILDANGNLKEMDTILDNIATQWNTLNNAEQVALAQSVAGIRQYNQFLALMGNWDVMEKNVELARDSTGELEKQNLIYSQGIEGTTARVQNTLDEIKNTLLDENDLIPLLEIANGFLGVVNDLLDAFGGLPTILLAVTTILTKMYSTQIAGALINAGNFMKTAALTLVGKNNMQSDMSNEAVSAGRSIAADTGSGHLGIEQSKHLESSFKMQQQLAGVESRITQERKQQLELFYQLVEKQQQAAERAAEQLDNEEKINRTLLNRTAKTIQGTENQEKFEKTSAQLLSSAKNEAIIDKELNNIKTMDPGISGAGTVRYYAENTSNIVQATTGEGNILESGQINNITQAQTQLVQVEQQLTQAVQEHSAAQQRLNELKEKKKTGNLTSQEAKEYDILTGKTKNTGKSIEDLNNKIKNLQGTQRQHINTIKIIAKESQKYEQRLRQLGKDMKLTDQQIEDLVQSYRNLIDAQNEYNNKSKEAGDGQKNFGEKVKEGMAEGKDGVQSFVDGFSKVTQAAMALNMITSAFDTLTDSIVNGEFSFSSFLSTIASMSMGLLMMVSVFNSLRESIIKSNLAQEVMQKGYKKGIALQTISTAISKLFSRQKKKEAKDVVEANAEEQVSNTATAMTEVGKFLGMGPVGWAIAAISLALIAAVVGTAISIGSKSAAKNRETNAQLADEDFNATKEEVDKNKETLTSYMDALQTYKETGQEKDKLAEAAKEAANAYGIEGAAVAALTGDYEGLTKKLREARVAELEKLKSSAEAAERGNEYTLEEAMREGKGHKSGKGYVAEFNTGASWSGESGIQGIAERYAKDPQYSDIIKYDPDSGDVRLELPDRSSDSFIKAYDAVDAIVKEARDAGVTTESDIYNEMNAWLSKSSESIEKIRGYKTSGIDAEAGIAIQNAKTPTGKGMDEVSNYKEFQEYKKAVFKGVTDPESEEYKARERLLTEEKGLADYVLIDQAVQDQSKAIKANVDAEFTDTEKQFVDSLQNAYVNASEEMIRAMAGVEVYPGMTFTDFMEQAKSNLVDSTQSIKEESAEAAKKSALQADTYTRALQANNEALQKNQVLANIVTTRAIKMNNSIEKVTKAWNDNVDAILNNSNNLADYSYALGEVSDGLKELFGINDKEFNLTDYISQNAELLKSYFSSGDLQDFQEIQKGIGQEFATAKAHMGDFHGLLTELTAEDYEVGENITLSENLKTIINQILSKDGGELALQNFEAILGIDIQIDTATDTVSSISKIDNGEFIQGYFDDIKKDAEKRKLKLDDEIERYYIINHTLEDIERGLDNIGKAKDRAFGRDKLGYIKEEKKLLDEQISSYDEKIKQIEKNLPKDREAVAKYGFDIDDQGNITNYDDIYEARLNEYNAAMETASKDKQETIKENWKEFKDSLKQYEETIEEYENTRDAKTEAEYERISKNLEEIRYEVELTTSVSERSLEDIDHQLNAIEDDAFKAAEAIALMGKKAEIAKNNSEANTKGIEKILNTKGISKDELINIAQNTNLSEEEKQQQLFALFGGKQLNEEETEELQNYINGLWESNEAIREQYEAIQDQVVSAYEKWNEELGYNIEMLERSQSMLESYRNIIDIVGKDTLGISNEIMDQMGQANAKMAQQSVEMARTRYETLKEAYDKATQEGGGVDEETRRELEATMLDAQQEFMDSWASSLEAAAAEFESSVERIMEVYDSAMDNLSEKSEWFEKQQTLQDFFLKDYEKTYEISKLNRQISQSIDSNDSIAAQRKLRDIQSELLDYQKQGKNMSDYDLQYLQKKYDLTMAQNALEDAQNAKSQARLIRGSSGNFGYVYTANQKNIESAQQQYEDKLYAMEQFLDKSQNDLSKQWFELNQQWADEMAALDKNAEDYSQKAADITAYYTELMENVSGEMTDMVQYGMEINQEYGTHAAETFNETILGKMYTDYTTFEGLQAKATKAMQTSLENIIGKHNEFKSNVDDVMEAAGTSVKDFKDNYITWMGEAEKANGDLLQDTKDTAKEMGLQFTAIVNAADKFAKDYNTKLSGIRTANDTLAKSINDLITAYSTLTGEDVQGKVNETLGKTTGQGATGGNGNGSVAGFGGNTAGLYSSNSLYSFISKANPKKSSKYYGVDNLVYIANDSGQGSYARIEDLRTEDGKSLTLEELENLSPDQKITLVDGATLLSSADINQTNDIYSIEEVQKGTLYDLYKINGKLYKQSDINFFGGKSKGDKVSLLNGASPTNFDTPTLGDLGISFNTENSWKIREYDSTDGSNNTPEEGKMATLSHDKINGPKNIEKLNKWKIQGYYGKSNLYKFDKYYDLASLITKGAHLTEHSTEYINTTDLTQLLKNKEILSTYNFKKFDTGGYTGSWGPEGRMAMLHQKEIVLNAHDTENFLTAIKIVRSIADKLDTNVMLAAQGLGNIVAAAAVNNTTREVLEQNVTIHAEFPNATDHNEIELAFNDLINQASQYVNRR